MFSLRSQTAVDSPALSSPFRQTEHALVAVRRPTIEVDPFVVRASARIASQDVFDVLARQPTLGVPAKTVWDTGGGFALTAELLRREDLRRDREEATDALYEAFEWMERGTPQQPSTPGATLVEILKETGCVVRPGSPTSCFAEVSLGGSVYRVLVSEWPSFTVQISFPTTTLRVEGEVARRAVALFALEANKGLRLARVSVSPIAADRLRLAWDVVVRGVHCSGPRLSEALEALVVARDETVRALRMLCTVAVAEAYQTRRRQLTR